MHFPKSLYLGLIAALVVVGPARTQDARDPLRLYAVGIGIGHGVYLGKGIVISAAHVAAAGSHVQIAGADLTTKVIKQDNDVDLILLSIDEHLPARLGLRRMPLCENPPRTSQQVIVAVPQGVVRSHVLSPSQLPSDIRIKFRTAIQYVGPGNSGAGVFDANEKCLLGIITQKMSLVEVKQVNGREVRERRDIAKYFVPVTEIAKFIPPELRF